MWEKIEEKLKELGKKNTGLKKAVMDWAKDAALRHHLDRMAGKPGQRNLKNIFSFFSGIKSPNSAEFRGILFVGISNTVEFRFPRNSGGPNSV